MSKLWTFSPSSQAQLQRCIEAALLQDNDNKWTRQFGRKTSKNIDTTQPKEEKLTNEIIEIDATDVEVKNDDVLMSYEYFFESIETEFRLDLIVDECRKNPSLFVTMAEKFTSRTVDILFNLIFSSTECTTDFFSGIFCLFLPTYLKKGAHINISLLIKIYENHSGIFKELLTILITDTEIPSDCLNNYLKSQDMEIINYFIKTLTNIELSSQSFIHHLPSIEMAYSQCEKISTVQEFIKSCLLRHGSSSVNDRNYGKLFMLYLQAEKSLPTTINVKQLEDCLDTHRSPFKRPCLTLLREFEN